MFRKNLKFIAFLVLSFASVQIANACINDEEESVAEVMNLTAQDGLTAIQDSIQKNPKQLYAEKFNQPRSNEEISELEALQKAALKELLTGDKAKALQDLQEIEKKFPGGYNTASNLGTAYELNGNNTDALKWIEEGIKRNNDSHNGTEWLHALILEAKIKLDADPHYYDSRRVLELPDQIPDEGLYNFFTYNEKGFTQDQVESALAYQLAERTVFIKPEEIIVADLLFSLGKIAAQDEDFETALSLLDLAKQYGFKDLKLWQETYSGFEAKKSGK